MKAFKDICIIVLLTAGHAGAQTLSNQVINSGGAQRTSTALGISVTDNIGEPFTEPLNQVTNMMITQGFLQPEIKSGLTIMKNNPTCVSRDDGFISIAYSTLNSSHQEQYIWSSNVVCPPPGCGSRASNLGPGTYSVMVVSSYSVGSQPASDTLRSPAIVINSSNSPCLVEVYTGVTPNGDGTNDTWRIENISLFPGNRVTLYNRWGTMMFDTRDYDNDNNFWPKPELLNTLVSSTYFYIIELGDGTKPLKGWVELLKN